ncbi:14503_t:CDS:2 [Entrophospora sp. SA101]|nr:14503_t:CDS:2 [Entrophospora sp. SA101]
MSQVVKLYIYDLSRGFARTFSMGLVGRQIDGIFHTSVEIFGKEWYFGQQDQGIFNTSPGQTILGAPQEIIDMGETEIPENIFLDYVDELKEKYSANSYHLFERNCNHFSNDLCEFLTGKSIPKYITDLPNDFLSTPFGQQLYPILLTLILTNKNLDNLTSRIDIARIKLVSLSNYVLQM